MTTVQVTQGHLFRYQSKARIRLPIKWIILIHIQSCTVAELSRSIGLIIAFDRGGVVPLLTYWFIVNL